MWKCDESGATLQMTIGDRHSHQGTLADMLLEVAVETVGSGIG